MLTIRPDQMRTLGALMRGRFVDGEIRRVRDERPQQAARVSDDTIRQFVEQTIQRAGDHGLVAVGDVQRYIDLAFRLGPNFDTDASHAPVRALLEARDTSGKLRLDRVDRLLIERGID